MIDLKIRRRPVMHSNQIVQAFLHCLGVHGTSAGEFHTVAESDLHRSVIHKLIVCGKPGLHFHVVVILEQCFAYSIAHRAPSRIIVMRIQPRVSHFLTVSCSAVNKGFLLPGKCLNRQTCCQHCSRQNGRDYFFLHIFLLLYSSLYFYPLLLGSI